jgi:hypothetical protein
MFSYVTMGTFAGFGGNFVILKPPRCCLGIPQWCLR